MKTGVSYFYIILALCFSLFVPPVSARTLVFTYTSPGVIIAYNDHPILFTITRDLEQKAQKSVIGLNQTTSITLTDDGESVLRPYLLNVYVPPFRGQQLPYPVFLPSPGAGKVTVSIDGAEPSEVIMFIDPFEGLNAGPMAASFIF